MVTGGTGALGSLVARFVVEELGVGRLVLVSRRGLGAPGAVELVGELEGLGAVVEVVACDVADGEALGGVLAGIPEEFPLRGVFHVAGVVDDGVVSGLSGERLAGVLAPKVAGALNLHRLTSGCDLSAFVLFSSVAGVVGSAGQGGYAAANAFVDGLARVRRGCGLAGVSLAWGPWAGGGMVSRLGVGERERLGRSGLVPLGVGEGLGLLGRSLGAPGAVVVPVRVDVGVVAAGGEAFPGLLRSLAGPVRRSAAAGGVGVSGLAGRLAGLGGGEALRVVLEVVRGEAAGVLGFGSGGGVDAGRAFAEMGFDSLTAVELRNRLGVVTGLRLPPTLVFDHPNPTALAQHLVTRLLPEVPSATVSMLQDLDKLEAAVPELDRSDRARIRAKMEALLAKWGETQKADEAPDDRDVESATEANIFDLIDSELENTE